MAAQEQIDKIPELGWSKVMHEGEIVYRRYIAFLTSGEPFNDYIHVPAESVEASGNPALFLSEHVDAGGQ